MKIHGSPKFIHYDSIHSFDVSVFESKIPYPWHDFDQFLTRAGFKQLYRSFPDVSLFEKQVGFYRGNQKPHDRYLLSYEDSVYHESGYEGKGVIQHDQLPSAWQRLIEELERPNGYKSFVRSILKTNFKFRYEWHLGFSGSQISPHVDIDWKLGSHLFYFNTQKDWSPRWGGRTLILGNHPTRRRKRSLDFSDFKLKIPVDNQEHHSLFMKNTPSAWHGVKPLRGPEGKFRRVFIVFFVPLNFSADQWLTRSLTSLLKFKPKASRSKTLRR